VSNLTLITQIRQLGFSENEAKCYVALFERDSLTASEVANLTGIARPNAYEAMKRLVAKGMCLILPGKVKKYSVSNPDMLKGQLFTDLNASLDSELENLEKKRQEIFKQKKVILDIADTTIAKLNILYQTNRGNSDPLDYIEILRNPEQIHKKFLELYSKAQKEVVAFIKPPFAHVTQAQLEEQFSVQDEGIKKGVIRKAIFEVKTDEQAKKLLTVSKSNKGNIGEQFNVIDNLPIKFFVFDEYACYFALEDPITDRTSLTMLIAEHNALAMSFKILFETFWGKARDYYFLDGKKYNV
jgi:sugar-specific transcriptional regulator TrmB